MSQEVLADEADINRTYISKLKTGAAAPGLEVIIKLARTLAVEPYELIKPQR